MKIEIRITRFMGIREGMRVWSRPQRTKGRFRSSDWCLVADSLERKLNLANTQMPLADFADI